jgi:hypothetical protein
LDIHRLDCDGCGYQRAAACRNQTLLVLYMLIEQWDQSSGELVSAAIDRVGEGLKNYDWNSFFATSMPTRGDYVNYGA